MHTSRRLKGWSSSSHRSLRDSLADLFMILTGMVGRILSRGLTFRLKVRDVGLSLDQNQARPALHVGAKSDIPIRSFGAACVLQPPIHNLRPRGTAGKRPGPELNELGFAGIAISEHLSPAIWVSLSPAALVIGPR